MSRIIPFAGGLLIGLALGVLTGAYPLIALTVERNTILVIFADTLMGAIGGAMVMWKLNKRRGGGVQLQGRFWRFPQGNLMVQISLKRMGSLMGVGGEE